MRTWWREADPVAGLAETVIGPDLDLASTIDRVLADCDWARQR